MFSVCRYHPSQHTVWDSFVNQAKNGLFLFRRDYMEYHAERFKDHSLCIFRDGDLFAVMPACERKGELQSHGGLTFGGIVSDERMKTTYMIEAAEAIATYLKQQGFACWLYKSIPFIYSAIPTQEDDYALFLRNASLSRCEVSSAICGTHKLPFSQRRERCIRKAHRHGLEFCLSDDYHGFFSMLSILLKDRHNTRPTHSHQEMQLLAARFPENIVLWIAKQEGRMLAGVILYLHARVAHAQYIAASDEGKERGALDALFDHLLRNVYGKYPYFDFGISTEDSGRQLNAGLITQKEEFGARAIVHNTWVLQL